MEYKVILQKMSWEFYFSSFTEQEHAIVKQSSKYTANKKREVDREVKKEGEGDIQF